MMGRQITCFIALSFIKITVMTFRFITSNVSFILFWILSMQTALTLSQSVRYELHMESPVDHYFQIDMFLSGYKTTEIEVKLPVWTPGSYLVREFSKNIDIVQAFDEQGRSLSVRKKNKNSWIIDPQKSKEIKVSYQVYAFELTVRTSFLDATHGFVSGTGIFMYTEQTRNKTGKLTVFPHRSFAKITTSLPLLATKSTADHFYREYSFDNYDQLVDCPIEIGNHEEFSFTAANVVHTVAMYGWGNYDIPMLQRDMAKIVEVATDVFGHNPNKNYVFIIHNVTQAQGGLEHVNSTTLSVNRYTYQGDSYLGFLSLVAHEYFHLWNVKRLRPFELGPFNYDAENYTSMLWIMEGFTSYYDELLMLRAGFYTENQLLNKFLSTLNHIEGIPGAKVQPVAHASFDAWIKAYRSNENSSNTTVSYYSKGSIMALLLDVLIIDKYAGEKSLDHFLRLLYAKYFQQQERGFTEAEFEMELTHFLGMEAIDFLKNYIYDTKTPDYTSICSKVGWNLLYVGTPTPSLGASLLQSDKQLTIQVVRSGSAAQRAGLSPNDEIIACNGIRMNKTDLERLVENTKVGDTLQILVSRDNVLLDIPLVLTQYERPKYQVAFATKQENTDRQERLHKYWLRSANK